MTEKKHTSDDRDVSAIAIVGMACRVPGAATLEQFWNVLRDGRDTATRFTRDELLAAGTPPAQLEDERYVPVGQVLADAELFDAEFFRLTRDEVEILDPQHRHFLECAHEALERAGCNPDTYAGAIGVFAGAGMNTYVLHNLYERYRAASTVDRYGLMLASDKDYLATRVSFKLNLRGPSLTVNTACSTSLVAVHTACMSLLSGDCDIALAGAVHVKVPQVEGYLCQEGMIFSPDGRCRAFDASAQGTILGSGVGVVVLKRLDDALEERDHIHAIIRGTAINNDGAAKSGYTAPSVEGQAAVIRDAQLMAGCDPDTVSYVEAHGTGTALGDPIEVAALARAFVAGTTRQGYCAIGSVKTNIGHLDVAAGMAGLIKTALMLERRTLVPSLHFETPNPEIDFAATPFYVNTALREWPSGATPRRAGVSAFGIGGTNAHAVLEEPPARSAAPAVRQSELLVVSARTPEALETATTNIARYLKQHPDTPLADVAYTLAAGRRSHRLRRALVAGNASAAALTLVLGDRDHVLIGDAPTAAPEVVFVFDDEQEGAASALFRELPAFADALAARIRSHQAFASANPETVIQDTSPPAARLRALAYADLWSSWGIRAVAIAGRGSGDEAARRLAEELGVPLQREPLPDTIELRVQPSAGANLDMVLRELGRLWVSGVEVDWRRFYSGERRRRVPLPTYPFQRARYWVEAAEQTPAPETGSRPLAVLLRGRPDAERVPLIVDFLQHRIADMLGWRDGQLPDPQTNLFDLGLSSLVLIEISSTLSADLSLPVAASSFIEHPTIRAFVENLATTLQPGVAVPSDDGSRTSRRAAASRSQREVYR